MVSFSHAPYQATENERDIGGAAEAGEVVEILGCQQLLKISLLCSVSNDDGRDKETRREGKGKQALITTGQTSIM